jgi:hypothetical protein
MRGESVDGGRTRFACLRATATVRTSATLSQAKVLRWAGSYCLSCCPMSRGVTVVRAWSRLGCCEPPSDGDRWRSGRWRWRQGVDGS